MKLVIQIPCFNEQEHILEVLENIPKKILKKDAPIIQKTDNDDFFEFSKESFIENGFEILKEKNRVSEERLLTNTISLNDLIDEGELLIQNVGSESQSKIDVLEIGEGYNNYTIDDYKRIVKMLNSLKEHSNSTDIKVDDAVAISLISNYSIDDCLKFKNILENNLN